MSGIRAVAFDCYGTLVDILTNEHKDEIFNHLSLYLHYYRGGIDIDAGHLKSLYYSQKERYLQTNPEPYPEPEPMAPGKSLLPWRQKSKISRAMKY